MNTGIYRRIDDLGRIVIPKNIRTAMHIDVGDMMEIVVADGKVLLIPYAPLSEVNFVAETCVQTCMEYDLPAIVTTNRDILISYRKTLPKHSLLSPELKERFAEKKEYIASPTSTLPLLEQEKVMVNAMFPICKYGELYGSLVIVRETNATLTELQIEKGRLIAGILRNAVGETR